MALCWGELLVIVESGVLSWSEKNVVAVLVSATEPLFLKEAEVGSKMAGN